MQNENYYLPWQFTLTQNHTQYSNLRLRDCIIKENELIDYALKLGHEVVAITDHESVSNSVKVEKYYNKIKKDHPNFKVILGNEIYLCRNGLNGQNFIPKQDRYYHFILLAKDAIGHKQIREISTRAWQRNVQVMIEGPGHMAMNEIAANMEIEKRLCHGAPFYVLGPLVTDIAPGYDHITSAIGGAIAAANGADFLCYVTPAEHLRLPDLKDVKEGIVASKIAAHAADIAKGVPNAREIDNKMSDARRRIDWEEMFSYAIDGEKARDYFESLPPADRHTCSMCGKMCAMRTTNKILSGEKVEIK